MFGIERGSMVFGGPEPVYRLVGQRRYCLS